MALTPAFLKSLPSYSEWKEDNPVDRLGRPIRADNEFNLRKGYADFVEKSTPQATPDQRAMLREKDLKHLAESPEIESEEEFLAALKRYNAISTREKTERIFRDTVDGGVRGDAPAYYFLGDALNGQATRQQLEADEFDATEFLRISDKMEDIASGRGNKPQIDKRPRHIELGISLEEYYKNPQLQRITFTSPAERDPEAFTISETEQAYYDRFAEMVGQYSEEVWPDYKKLVQRQVGAVAIDVPRINPVTKETENMFVLMDDVPDDQHEAAVEKSIQAGLLHPDFKENALKALKAKDKDGNLEVDVRNYYEALQKIQSAANIADTPVEGESRLRGLPLDVVDPESVQHNFKDSLRRLSRQAALSHSKHGGVKLPFVRSPKGQILPQTELIEGKATLFKPGELLQQDYKNLLDQFRGAYRGSVEHLSDEVVLKALQDTVYNMAVSSGLMPFHEGKKKLPKLEGAVGAAIKGVAYPFVSERDVGSRLAGNIYTTEYGARLVHPRLLVAKNDFAALKRNAEKLGTTEDKLELERLTYLENNYDRFLDDIFNSTADIRNSWITHVGKEASAPFSLDREEAEKVAKGRIDVEILANWLDTEKGTNWINRLGQSAIQGSGDLVGMALMGGGYLVNKATGVWGDAADFWTGKGSGYDRVDISDDPVNPEGLEKAGAHILLNSAKERQANRAVAGMFGRKHSFMDVGSTMAVPLIIDLSASAALAVPTAGIGSTAYASAAFAKYGLKATAKSYLHGAVGMGLKNILREGAEDSVQVALEKAYAKGFLKTLPSVKVIGKGADKWLPSSSAVGFRSPYAVGTRGGKRAQISFANLPKGVLPKRYVENIIKNSGSVNKLSGVLPSSMRAEAATDALVAISKGIKAGQYPAISAPAFLRSAGHTYGDIHMALQGAVGPDGKPLSPAEIHDRAFGGSVMAGMFTVATVVGLQRIGMGGLEDWVTGGATIGQVRRVFEKLRTKKYLTDDEAVIDMIKQVVGEGLKSVSGRFKGPIARGALYESLQEGSDAWLNTFARSFAMEMTSEDDWNRPFMTRVHEMLMGAAYGLGLGAMGGALHRVRRPQSPIDQMRTQQDVLAKLSLKVHDRLVSKLEETGSTETAATVKEIFSQLDLMARTSPEKDVRKKLESEKAATETGENYEENKAAEIIERLAELHANPLPSDAPVEAKEKLRDEAAELWQEYQILKGKLEETPESAPEAEAEAVGEKTESTTESPEEPAQSEEDQQLDNTQFTLTMLGLVDLEADLLAAANDPLSTPEEDRQTLIDLINEQYDKVKDNTRETEGIKGRQKYAQARDYLIAQITTGVTEEAAGTAQKGASTESIQSAIDEVLSEDADAADAKLASGTGEAVITRTAKEELIEGLKQILEAENTARPVGEQVTPEIIGVEANRMVSRLMESVRRDLKETEDLAKFDSLEEELRGRLEDAQKAHDGVKAAARKGGRREYQGGVSKEYFTETPNEGTIAGLQEVIDTRRDEIARGVGTTKSQPTRKQQLIILESLLETLQGFRKMNLRREQIKGQQDEERRIREFQQAEEARARMEAEEKAAKEKKGKEEQPPAPELTAEEELAELKSQREELLDRTARGEADLLTEELGAKDRTIRHHKPDPIPYDLIRKYAEDKQGVFGRQEDLIHPVTEKLIWSPDQTTPLTDEQIKALADIGVDLDHLTVDTRDFYTVGRQTDDAGNPLPIEQVEFPMIFETREAAEKLVLKLRARAKEGLGKHGMTAGAGVGIISTGDPALLQPKLDRLNERIERLEASLKPDSDPPPDPSSVSLQRETFVQNMIRAGALKSGSAGEHSVAVMGLPKRLNLSSAERGQTGEEIREGVKIEFPSLSFNENNRPVTYDYLREAYAAQGVIINDDQWATVRSSGVKFGGSNIWLIKDIDGGIFDDGRGGRTGHDVVLFNNDPRSMRKAFDDVGHESIMVPNGFNRTKVNKTFRGDKTGRSLSQDTGVVKDIFYPVELDTETETSITGLTTRTYGATPDEITYKISSRAQTLMEFINPDTPIIVRLDETDPVDAKAPQSVRESSIKAYKREFTAWLNGNVEAGKTPINKEALGKILRADSSTTREGIRSLYFTGLSARADRAVVEVALLQALANKAEGQSDADAMMSVLKERITLSEKTTSTDEFKSAVTAFESLIGRDVTFESDKTTLAFVLSEFLMGDRLATAGPLGVEMEADPDLDIVDWVLGRVADTVRKSATEGRNPRNESAADPEAWRPPREGGTLRRKDPPPVPNLYNPKNDLLNLQTKYAQLLNSDNVQRKASGTMAHLDDADSGDGVQALLAEEGPASSVDEPRVSEELEQAAERLEKLPEAEVVMTGVRQALATTLAESEKVVEALETLQEGILTDLDLESPPLKSPLETYQQVERLLHAAFVSPEHQEYVRGQLAERRAKFLETFVIETGKSEQGLLALMDLVASRIVNLKPQDATQLKIIRSWFSKPEESIAEVSLSQIVEVVMAYRAERAAKAPSYVDGVHRPMIEYRNTEDIAELGLVDGDMSTVIEALRNMEGRVDVIGDDPMKKLASTLFLEYEEFLNTLDIRIIKGAPYFAGSYDEELGMIFINTNGRYGEGVSSVLLHEVGHAIFQKIMTTPDEDLTPPQRAARKEMRVVYERAKEQWVKAKSKGKADPVMDYVFGTGRATLRARRNRIVDPLTGLAQIDFTGGDLRRVRGMLASGDISSSSERELDLSQPTAPDIILPRAQGSSFEEFYTVWMSSTSFQAATRKIAVQNRSLFRRIMDGILKLFGKTPGVYTEAEQALEAVFDFTNHRNSNEVTQLYEEQRGEIVAAVAHYVKEQNFLRSRYNALRGTFGLLSDFDPLLGDPTGTVGRADFLGGPGPEYPYGGVFDLQDTVWWQTRTSFKTSDGAGLQVERDLFEEYSKAAQEWHKAAIDLQHDPDFGTKSNSIDYDDYVGKRDEFIRKANLVVFERLLKDEVSRRVPSGMRIVYLNSDSPLLKSLDGTVDNSDQIAFQTWSDTIDVGDLRSGVPVAPAPLMVVVLDNAMDSVHTEVGLVGMSEFLDRGDPKQFAKVIPPGPTHITNFGPRPSSLARRDNALRFRDNIEALVTEELVHAVDDLSTTDAEVDQVIEEIGIEGLIEMSAEYHLVSPRFERERERRGYVPKERDTHDVVVDTMKDPNHPDHSITRRNILAEGVRAEVQKRITGRPSEDVSLGNIGWRERFYIGESAPGSPFMRLVRRQLTGFFTKVMTQLGDMRARVGTEVRSNPRLQEMAHRVHLNLKALYNEESEELGFLTHDRQTELKAGRMPEFDPSDPNSGVKQAIASFDALDSVYHATHRDVPLPPLRRVIGEDSETDFILGLERVLKRNEEGQIFIGAHKYPLPKSGLVSEERFKKMLGKRGVTLAVWEAMKVAYPELVVDPADVIKEAYAKTGFLALEASLGEDESFLAGRWREVNEAIDLWIEEQQALGMTPQEIDAAYAAEVREAGGHEVLDTVTLGRTESEFQDLAIRTRTEIKNKARRDVAYTDPVVDVPRLVEILETQDVNIRTVDPVTGVYTPFITIEHIGVDADPHRISEFRELKQEYGDLQHEVETLLHSDPDAVLPAHHTWWSVVTDIVELGETDWDIKWGSDHGLGDPKPSIKRMLTKEYGVQHEGTLEQVATKMHRLHDIYIKLNPTPDVMEDFRDDTDNFAERFGGVAPDKYEAFNPQTGLGNTAVIVRVKGIDEHSHTEQRDTLVWVRGKFIEGDDGKIIFRVDEIQSDAAQRDQKNKPTFKWREGLVIDNSLHVYSGGTGSPVGGVWQGQELDRVEILQAGSREFRRALSNEIIASVGPRGYAPYTAKMHRDFMGSGHPLYPHASTIGLRAAITHALQHGADSIFVPDGGTAMLTEGHHLIATNEYGNPAEEIPELRGKDHNPRHPQPHEKYLTDVFTGKVNWDRNVTDQMQHMNPRLEALRIYHGGYSDLDDAPPSLQRGLGVRETVLADWADRTAAGKRVFPDETGDGLSVEVRKITPEGYDMVPLKVEYWPVQIEVEATDLSTREHYSPLSLENQAIANEALQTRKFIRTEKGMRLAYDNTLPDGMAKLTGDSGKTVDLGQHKLATKRYVGQAAFDDDGTFQTAILNPDGSPHSGTTGKLFSLEGAKTKEEEAGGIPLVGRNFRFKQKRFKERRKTERRKTNWYDQRRVPDEQRRVVEAALRKKFVEGIEVGQFFENGKFLHYDDIEGKWGSHLPKQWAAIITRGKQDPRVMRMIKDYERWSEAANALLKSDLTLLEKLLTKAYKGPTTAPPDVQAALNLAVGTTDKVDVDVETKKGVIANFKRVVKQVRAEVLANKRPVEHSSEEAIKSLKETLVTKVLERLRFHKIQELKAQQKTAYKFLEQDTELGPAIVDSLKATRATIDSLSTLVSKQFKLSDVNGGKIGLTFDSMLGLYLTRGYRIFNDLAYLTEVMNPDGKFQDRRDAALPFFEQEQIKVHKKLIEQELEGEILKLDKGIAFTNPAAEAHAKMLKGLSSKDYKAEVNRRAEEKLKDNPELAVAALNAFLADIEATARGRSEGAMSSEKMKKELGEGVYQLSRVEVDNLRAKADIDEGVRYLLGQFGLQRTEDGSFEEQGLANLHSTLATLTRMAEGITFWNDLKTVGGVKDGDLENAFVYTLEEAQQAGLTKEGARPYVNARTGHRLTMTSLGEEGEGVAGVFDPTFDMYVPEDLYQSMRRYKRITRGNLHTWLSELSKGEKGGARLGSYAAHVFLKMNALMLFTKTVLNVPAYHLRNAITALTSYSAAAAVSPVGVMNEFFWAFVRSRAAARGESKVKSLVFGRDPRIKTGEQILMQRIGVDQGNMDVNFLSQLAQKSKQDPYQLFYDGFREIMDLHPADMTEEGMVKKGLLKLKRGAKGGEKYVIGPVFQRLSDFAQGIDAAAKIAMFKKELKVLRQAKKSDQDNKVDTGYHNMTDEQMEFEAARKTRAMSPTYSEAPLFAKWYRKANPIWGDPFGSFFLDQFRIVWNQSMGIPSEEQKSGNPIIRNRGYLRQTLALGVHSATPAAAVGSALLLGINPTDEEEELLKAAAPAWGKLNQWIYMPGDVANKIFGFMPGASYDPDELYALDLTYINASSPVFDGATAGILEVFRGDYDAAARNIVEGYVGRFVRPSLIGGLVGEAFNNKDGRVYDEQIDSLSTKAFKSLGYIAQRGVEPGNARRLRKYMESQKADDDTYRGTFEETLTQIVSPASPRIVRLDVAVYNYAREAQEDRRDLTSSVYKQLRDPSTGLADADIEKLAKLIIAQRRDIDQRLGHLTKTAMDLGALSASRERLRTMLMRTNIGSDRAGAILDGATERFIPDKNNREEFLGPESPPWKRERFNKFEEALRKHGPQYRFTDPETGLEIR